MIDILFECLDALDKYLECVRETSEEGTDDNEAIIKELNDYISAAEGGAPAKKEEKEPKEEPKKEPPVQAGEKKFLDIELSANEKEAFQNAKEAGKHIYGFTVESSEGVFGV